MCNIYLYTHFIQIEIIEFNYIILYIFIYKCLKNTTFNHKEEK